MADYYGMWYEDVIRDPDLPPFYRAAVDGDTELLLSCLPSDINKLYRWKAPIGFQFYCTALHLAAYRGEAATVQTLLERGAEFDVEDYYEWTPLHLASYTSKTDVVQLLLDHGADPSARDDIKQTPLLLASDSKTNKTEVVQLLLEHGADPSARDYRQYTPLHRACLNETSNTAVVQLLLDHGADISARGGGNQRTSLHLACLRETSNTAVVKLLLDHGADPSARDNNNNTPVQLALHYNKFESPSLMLTKAASPQQTWVKKLVSTAEVTQDMKVKKSILSLCEDLLLNSNVTVKDEPVLYWGNLGLTDTSLREKLQQLPKDVRYHAVFLHNNTISTLLNLQSYRQLLSLSYLVISDNPINTIEGLPPQLKGLYCKRTEIQVLGKACFHEGCIKVLKHALKIAKLYDSLKQPPYQVFEHGLNDILRYFTKELVTNSQYRVVAIGDTGAGKSSCLESVVLGKPYLTRAADRTHVLDLKHWRVSDEDFFTFFDQGGHEVYDITNPYFIAIKSMVLLFQDLSKTKNIPRTLDILRRSLHQHPQNAIHFVLTHIDQVDQVKQSVRSFKKEIQELLQGEISTFKRLLASPKNKGYIQKNDVQSLLEHCQEKQSAIQYFSISSKTYEGIEELKTFLKSTIEKQRVNIPTLWIDCLQKMEERKVSFWTKSKLMKVINVSQSDGQVNLSSSKSGCRNDDSHHKVSKKDKRPVWNKVKKLMKLRSVNSSSDKREVPSASDHNSEVLDCLRYLNDTGIVIWMEDHDTLKEYIFHNMEFLIEVLKSLFHHDLKSTIQYETDLHLQSVFTETEFEDTLNKYQEEGILKLTFLKYLWQKYELQENDELALIALIRRFHMFSEIPSDQDKVFFVPWFVKKNEAPPNFNVSDPLVINSKEVSLNIECLFHNRLPLNVTEQFLVEVQGYVHEHGVKDSRYAWADGLQVQSDETTITAFRNVDQATLSLVITAECECLVKIWDSLQQLNESLMSILKFYHGSLRSHHSNCLHCKKVGNCPVHRWLLEDVLPKSPYKNLYMRCVKDKTAKIPAALVTRMPNDDKKKRLEIVKTYLQTGKEQQAGSMEMTKRPQDQQDKYIQISATNRSAQFSQQQDKSSVENLNQQPSAQGETLTKDKLHDQQSLASNRNLTTPVAESQQQPPSYVMTPEARNVSLSKKHQKLLEQNLQVDSELLKYMLLSELITVDDKQRIEDTSSNRACQVLQLLGENDHNKVKKFVTCLCYCERDSENNRLGKMIQLDMETSTPNVNKLQPRLDTRTDPQFAGRQFPTDIEMLELAKCIGAEKLQMATYLGLSKQEVERIKEDNIGKELDQIYKILVLWRDRSNSNCEQRSSELQNSFNECGRVKLAKMVQQFYVEYEKSQQDVNRETKEMSQLDVHRETREMSQQDVHRETREMSQQDVHRETREMSQQDVHRETREMSQQNVYTENESQA